MCGYDIMCMCGQDKPKELHTHNLLIGGLVKLGEFDPRWVPFKGQFTGMWSNIDVIRSFNVKIFFGDAFMWPNPCKTFF